VAPRSGAVRGNSRQSPGHLPVIAAIVPAAGLSRRMGRPKLTLPVEGGTVIASVVEALIQGGVETIVVVVPPRDAIGHAELVQSIRPGVHVVEASEQPPDMRASVELGIKFLSELAQTPETVLLAPGDLVGATAPLITATIFAARANPGRIVVPVVLGKRGHPVALPWSQVLEIPKLPRDVGVNALLKQRPAEVVECVVEEPGALVDLDTPEDYERWRLKQIL
jgi:molybdenum cofactor cytidylyltransferase